MKWRVWCICAMMAGLALAGCDTRKAGEIMQQKDSAHYYNDSYGYALNYPAGWTKTTKGGELILTSPDKKACVMISASSQDPEYDDEAMRRTDALAHIEEETLDMQEVSCDTSLIVGGFPATDVVYTAEEVLSQSDAAERKGRQVLVYGEDLVYDLDLIARVEVFDAADADFEVLLASFETK